MEFLLYTLVIMVLIYIVIPGFIARLGFGIFRKGQAIHQVAFTFDDGPDPRYTPQLLDLLKKHHIRATFFVVGLKAGKYPQIIRRMYEDGHLIGIHNYVHRSNWLMTPWKVLCDLDRSASIIENITGKRPIYYRPPWGMLNFFDLLRNKYCIVLWSVMVGDWRSKVGSEKIKQRLIRKLNGGAVIVLHDSGETWGADLEAPLNTIKALEDVFSEANHRGYKCVRIDEMTKSISRKKKLLITMWTKWDMLYNWLFNIKPIDKNHPLLKKRVCTYLGKTIQLSDGEKIQKGDRVLELHLNNEMLFNMGINSRSAVQLAIQMIRSTEQLLPKILTHILNESSEEIKGLYGVSIVHRGTKQFGFTVMDLPEKPLSYFIKLYLRLLMLVVHPSGKRRLKTKTELLVPKIIAISTKELRRRYKV
jgi:peptidoglycan/xylan/chitin deacetylase (PgdA/CDA1 family)